jgi:hypothetical protein
MSSSSRDKRAAQRFQVLGHAQLRAGPLLIHCVIRDLSQSGAKLGLPRQAKLPANSDLWLVQGDSRIRVAVKWREGDHVGVAFSTQRVSLATIAQDAEKRVVLDV